MTWQQGKVVIDQLLNRGELEKVAPNPHFAVASLDLCDKHIATAQAALADDPVAAVAIAYDAIAVARDAVRAARPVVPHLTPF